MPIELRHSQRVYLPIAEVVLETGGRWRAELGGSLWGEALGVRQVGGSLEGATPFSSKKRSIRERMEVAESNEPESNAIDTNVLYLQSTAIFGR